jgi:hypothetical protein
MATVRQKHTMLLGKRVRRGTRVRRGRAMRWKLLRGASVVPLKASLLTMFTVGGKRIAIFRII